jgi:hypothetical protein
MTGTRQPAPVVVSAFRISRAHFSPDGKWIAYTSDESGRAEIYVQSFPPGAMKWQVSSKGGDWVRWRDDNEIFYVAPDRKVIAVSVRPVSASLEFSAGTPLFTLPVIMSAATDQAPYSYDVTRGSQRFLALTPVAQADAPPMSVLVNWQAEVSAARK